jgi:hypothetical protein
MFMWMWMCVDVCINHVHPRVILLVQVWAAVGIAVRYSSGSGETDGLPSSSGLVTACYLASGVVFVLNPVAYYFGLKGRYVCMCVCVCVSECVCECMRVHVCV